MSLSIVPSLGLGYLASCLKQAGHEVKILDALRDGLSAEHVVKAVQADQPDIVGVTVLTLFYKEARSLVRLLKQTCSCKVAIGGHHVTALPEASLTETTADFAVIGEGEQTIVHLASELEGSARFEDVKGLAYRRNGSVVRNEPRPFIDNLDDIPFPQWDLIGLDRYPPISHGTIHHRFPNAPIITTRGCPYRCTFCAARRTAGTKLRKRSAGNVADEMEMLYRDFGIKEFHFEDDNFAFEKQHAYGICEELLRRDIRVEWSCPNGVRVDTLDDELLAIMKRSGCYMLALGIESASQHILDRVGKKLNIDAVPETVRRMRAHSILSMGFFILGLPGETEKTARETIEFAKKTDFDFVKFTHLVPLPGTEIFDELTEAGYDPEQFSGSHLMSEAVLRTEFLSAHDLTRLQKKAHREFYFRPRVFLRSLARIRWGQWRYLFARLVSVFFGGRGK
jgi:anaerobic magnesium-protoporphyrin IX monomethyl ester cyclase